jgi:CTP:molybdopterin cytidylyltransferase MocA
MTAAAIVLAAGGGSRFTGDTHKLLATFHGRPVVTWAVDAAVEAGFEHVIVVTGAVDLTSVLPVEVTIVHNEHWTDGIAGSLAGGIAVAGRLAPTIDAVVVGLGDQPMITAESWRAVAAADGAPIAVATYGGERRNPVRLDATVWPLLPISGDRGASTLMRGRPDLVQEVPCNGLAADIDTWEDLGRWS